MKTGPYAPEGELVTPVHLTQHELSLVVTALGVTSTAASHLSPFHAVDYASLRRRLVDQIHPEGAPA